MPKNFLLSHGSPRHRAAMRTYTNRLTLTLAVFTATLALLALTACRNPAEPSHLIVTCQPRYMPGLLLNQGRDTLWYRVPGEEACTWLDTTTGQGGPGRHP